MVDQLTKICVNTLWTTEFFCGMVYTFFLGFCMLWFIVSSFHFDMGMI